MSDSPNPLIRAREVSLKYNLTQAQFNKLEQSFRQYDRDLTGKITIQSATQIFEDLKTEDPAKAAADLVNSLDIDNNGEIELWEFVEHYGSKCSRKHDMIHNNVQQSKRPREENEEEDDKSADKE